jgi:acyl-CoA synthetase (AMP-forming)/AMP-acid ligase II
LAPEPAFRDLPRLVAEHARAQPAAPALVCGPHALSWADFDAQVERVAASLQRDGLVPRQCVAICAASSIGYVVAFAGALRAGLAVAPLAPGSTPAQLAAMAEDAQARLVFIDADVATRGLPWPPGLRVVGLEALQPGAPSAVPSPPSWLCAPGTPAQPVTIEPDWPFNIIYSSGTTGTPKGIVQPHAMRWAHVRRGALSGYGPQARTLIATPLYSNTTLVCLMPTLGWGGCAVLMPKFEVEGYLALAEAERITHTMLVPVQYQRLMAHPRFGAFDLSSFRFKFCTSAPFAAELKADILARWPGGLVEYYGMTEGGGTCILHAHAHPHKLHTVGQPAEGHDIRLIDEQGVEVTRTPGGASVASGEVVGRSPAMMTGYHGQSTLTREAEWFDAQGRRYIRTGDIGRFDEDGFLVLHDRRKDMVISGGFNIYPSDLEAVLRQHPQVAEVAVVGVPSARWGETPVAFVVTRPGAAQDAPAPSRPAHAPALSPDTSQDALAATLLAWANAQLGKTQRLAAVRLLAELPRSSIGKVLKRELRTRWEAQHASVYSGPDLPRTAGEGP